MIPIVLCSLVGVTIFFERLLALQRNLVVPERLLEVVSKLLAEREFDRAQALCNDNNSAVAHVLRRALPLRGAERSAIKEVMEEAGRKQASLLEKRVGALGSIASVTPLIGLLGTITGMIQAFQQIVVTAGDQAGRVDPSALASGIWEALITTAAGLSVAIPTFLMYKFIVSRVDTLLTDMEDQCLLLADVIAAGPAKAAPEGDE